MLDVRGEGGKQDNAIRKTRKIKSEIEEFEITMLNEKNPDKNDEEIKK